MEAVKDADEREGVESLGAWPELVVASALKPRPCK
jgi:hypothetical protein